MAKTGKKEQKSIAFMCILYKLKRDSIEIKKIRRKLITHSLDCNGTLGRGIYSKNLSMFISHNDCVASHIEIERNNLCVYLKANITITTFCGQMFE